MHFSEGIWCLTGFLGTLPIQSQYQCSVILSFFSLLCLATHFPSKQNAVSLHWDLHPLSLHHLLIPVSHARALSNALFSVVTFASRFRTHARTRLLTQSASRLHAFLLRRAFRSLPRPMPKKPTRVRPRTFDLLKKGFTVHIRQYFHRLFYPLS